MSETNNYLRMLTTALNTSEMDIARKRIERLAGDLIRDKSTGNIVTFGIGKSGQVAQKLSMSLVSIGFRSQHLDAASAVHGDVGIVDNKTTLIAISNSGTTPELLNAYRHLYKHKKPTRTVLITSASRPIGSWDTVITHTKVAEISKVPTYSLSLATILSDMLVDCIVNRTEDIDEIFRNNHPGGAIGQAYHMEKK